MDFLHLINSATLYLVVGWLNNQTVYLEEMSVSLSESLHVGYLKGAEVGLATTSLITTVRLGTAGEILL